MTKNLFQMAAAVLTLAGMSAWAADDKGGSTATATYIAVDISGSTYKVVNLGESAPDDLLTNARYKTDLIVMRKIPAGSFAMGSPTTEPNRGSNEVQRNVTLTQPYYLSVFEVTQAQYFTVTNLSPGCFGGNDLPVEMVSWADVRGGSWPSGTPSPGSFMGLMRSKGTGLLFDLPTEEQWEYACRAGTTLSYNDQTKNGGAGTDAEADLANLAWYTLKFGFTTHAVGGKQANAWGLYDMHGNVWEWCLDFYTEDAHGPVSPSSGRVLRGGGFASGAARCRSAGRRHIYADYLCDDIGFRLALMPTSDGR